MVDTAKEKAGAPAGRKQTDKSLRAERAKTDASMGSDVERAEINTDRIVAASRAEADDLLNETRTRIDESGESHADMTNAEVKALLAARRAEDASIEAKRADVDAALERERFEKRTAEYERFQTERVRTDADLKLERNQADADVQLSQFEMRAAQTALTTRDEFLAIVSHDLRNPLGCVSMAAHLLTSHSSYLAGDEEMREYVDTISRSVDESLRLISDLLDMERIASGKLALQVESQDIVVLIRRAAKSFQYQASTKNIAIEVPPSPQIFALCDSGRISQVLTNLIGNAIKFTPDMGSIKIGAELIKNKVQVSVADTGPGIPENMQKKVFERFWQIGKHDRRGLGLGLYIARMIIVAQHGRIWLTSEVGKGTTFFFTLPAVLKPESEI